MNDNLPKPKRRKFRQETVLQSFIARPLAQEIMLLIWNTNIKPNHITLFRIPFVILAMYLLAGTTLNSILLGTTFFLINEILDHVDGMLARAKNMKSKLGHFLDLLSDIIFASMTSIFGLVITFAAYRISGDISFWLFWAIFCSLSATYFCFGITFLKDKPKEDGINHDQEQMLAIWGVPIFIAITNLIKTTIIWNNYIFIFGLIILAHTGNSMVLKMAYVFMSLVMLLRIIKLTTLTYKRIK